MWESATNTRLVLVQGKAVAWLKVFSTETINNSRVVSGFLGFRSTAASFSDLASLAKRRSSIGSTVTTKKAGFTIIIERREKNRGRRARR